MNENEKTEAAVQEPETKTEHVQEQQPEKNYTKAELDAAVAQERKNVPSADELKAFNDWKEAQKPNRKRPPKKSDLQRKPKPPPNRKRHCLKPNIPPFPKA